MYFLKFTNSILHDDSDVVILKNRPSQLVKLLRRKTSKISIVEVDQLHPHFTRDILLNEYRKYNIKVNTIYTNSYAIKNYVSSFQLADILVVYSDFHRNQLISYGIKNVIKVVDLGFENIFPESIQPINLRGDVVFICFSHHTFVKGTQRLLDAWKSASVNHQLYILGSIGEDIHEYLKANEFGTNIKFINNFKSNDLYEFCLGKRIVGISLSLSDSFNRVLSEYLELGLPVIVSEILDRGISKNNLGIVVDAFNSNSIVNAINHLSIIENYDFYLKNFRNSTFSDTRRNKNIYGLGYIQLLKNLK